MKTEKTLISAAVLTACIGFAASASANFVVSFDQQSAFLFNASTPAPGTGIFGAHGLVDDRVTGYESIWWTPKGGLPRETLSDATPIITPELDPENPTAPAVSVAGVDQGDISALKVEGKSGSLTISSDGGLSLPQTLSYIYHRNNSIPATTTPLAGVIASSTRFTYNTVHVDDPSSLPFFFDETPNEGPVDGSGCPGPNLVGTRCDDVFQFPLVEFDELVLTIDGVKFGFQFGLVPSTLAATDLEECRQFALGVPGADCAVREIGGEFIPYVSGYTGEGDINFLRITVAGRVIPVPEPGTLSMFGLGLVGLGAMLRRRRTGVR